MKNLYNFYMSGTTYIWWSQMLVNLGSTSYFHQFFAWNHDNLTNEKIF
jgi:hypothetical protein